MARGGFSRRGASNWQAGNLVQARWTARLSDQLGGLRAEPVHQPAALVLDDPLLLGVLAAACAVAAGALPEREPHPRVFGGLLHLLATLGHNPAAMADLVRWEAALLADLGYGLDLSGCAVTGETDELPYVSPRSGRAVSQDGAGAFAARLLRLPRFLRGDGPADEPASWRDGLRLTGHFLTRDAFGHRHLPLPAARIALYDRVATLAETVPHA